MALNVTCVLDALSDRRLPEKDCFLELLSKCIGYAIITASPLVKVPQIYRILKNRSVEGLSMFLFEAEVIGFTIVLSYCLYKQLPFAAFGEVVFLVLQALIQLGLLYYYKPAMGPLTWLKVGIYSAIAPSMLAGRLDGKMYEALFASQHFIFLGSRIPQIWSNFKNKNTGQLSGLTTFANAAGGTARIFTGIQVKAPLNMIIGTTVGSLSNWLLLLQVVMYAPKKKASKPAKEKTLKEKKGE